MYVLFYFRPHEPSQHTLDTLEQAVMVLTERLTAIESCNDTSPQNSHLSLPNSK